LPSKTLYASVGAKAQEQLLEIFERTFELTLEPISSGTLALSILEPVGKKRDYEDLRPTRFVHGPDGESQHPEYPWIAKGPQPKDFLGNEFLLWLWHAADARDGEIQTEAVGPVTVFIDKVLELDCTYGMTGKDSLRGDGPSRMPEAREAVRSGKIPRRAGLILDVQRQEFRANFNAETLAFTAAQLPEVTDADNQRMVFEERVTMLRDLCAGMDALFAAFLQVRCSSAWESQTSGIRKWIMQGGKAAVAA